MKWLGRVLFQPRTQPNDRQWDYDISCSSAHAASHCRQAVSNCALASSKVDTRSERVIGQVTVNDQSQRRWS